MPKIVDLDLSVENIHIDWSNRTMILEIDFGFKEANLQGIKSLLKADNITLEEIHFNETEDKEK